MAAVAAAIERLAVGDPIAFQNLVMFPLLGEESAEASYLTLDAALASGGLAVTEVSHGGSVPDLLVTNTLDRAVLLLDGEEVIGARQNRVFNLTLLLAGKSKTVVPVSCVEAGRWSQVSPRFSSASRTQHALGRSARLAQVSHSLFAFMSRRSDQSQVWDEIARKQRHMEVASSTSAMADIYERYAVSIDQFVAALVPVESQRGAVFAVNSAITGVELFDCTPTLKALLPKIVRSYALDAIEVAEPGKAQPAAPAKDAAAAFLAEVGAAPAESFPAVGLGEDLRLHSDTVAGACLAVDGKLVHLCAFRIGSSGAAESGRAAMVRAAARRRYAERRHD